MRTLSEFEVNLVSGGTWADFWNTITGWLHTIFDGTGGVGAQVTLCTSNGGTANYTVNGSSYTVTTQAGLAAPVEGEVVQIGLTLQNSNVTQNYSVTCQGASGKTSPVSTEAN